MVWYSNMSLLFQGQITSFHVQQETRILLYIFGLHKKHTQTFCLPFIQTLFVVSDAVGNDYIRDWYVWNFLKADIKKICLLKHKQQARWTTFATWHFGKAIPLQNIINLFIVLSVKQPQCALMLLAVQEDQICIYSFIWLTGCISDFLSVLVI